MTPLTVLVLAGRGGPRLARTLDSVAWAAERMVWDVAGRLATTALPPGVRRIERLDGTTGPPWILLLREGEVVPPSLVRAIETAIARRAPDAYRLPLELRAFGARLRPRRMPLRLAARARVVLGRGLTPELSMSAAPGRLDVALVVAGADSLAAAIEDLEADGAALAAMLARDGRVARFHHLLGSPLVAAWRVLVAPGKGRVAWARWVLAVLAGYTAMVAWAKRWEQVQAAGAR